jgi:hypothetical protein
MQLLTLTLSIVLFLFKNDVSETGLFSSSGKNLFSWVQLIELVPISDPEIHLLIFLFKNDFPETEPKSTKRRFK